MNKLKLTHEQEALLNWIDDNAAQAPKTREAEWDHSIVPNNLESRLHAILEARAGSGKTTTLLQAALRIIQRDTYSRILVVAFNKRIATEIEGKAAKLNLRKPRFLVQTLHACGNAARMSLSEYRESTLNEHKVSDLVGNRINELRRASAGGNLAGLGLNKYGLQSNAQLDPDKDPVFVEKNKLVIESLVDFGRLYGVGISFQLEDTHVWDTIISRHITLPRNAVAHTRSRVSLIPDLLYHACEIIKQCESTASNEHDFVDMLWLPILSGAAFRQYDWVLVDEAQDTNELSRAIALASLAPNGRMIIVGDPHQCINGFQGADDNGIEVMRKALNAKTFPLTISQRCGINIVNEARMHTSCKDIRAREDAEHGVIMEENSSMFDYSIFKDKARYETSAILCRNNAPLLSLGFTLMRLEVPFRIAGGADLYGRLLRLASRWKVKDNTTLLFRLETHRANEVARLRSVSASSARIDAICDEVDMLVTIVKSVLEENPLAEPQHVLQRIVALKTEQENAGSKGILLSTIHKAKGLEWDHVYLLGADTLMPSQYATTDFDRSQEDHIRYVAITRARRQLTYLNLQAGDPDQDPHNGAEIAEMDEHQ